MIIISTFNNNLVLILFTFTNWYSILTKGNFLEIIKIQLFDWGFRYLSIALIKWVDPIRKSDFEKQLVLINILFLIINHFSILILIRVYLVNVHGKCTLGMDISDKTLAYIAVQDGIDLVMHISINLICFYVINIERMVFLRINYFMMDK